MSTRFINLIVTNGGNLGESFVLEPYMDGDNLINDAYITFVKGVTGAEATPNTFQIFTSFAANTKEVSAPGGTTEEKLFERVYTLSVATNISGDYGGNTNRPSAEWMLAAKKAISAAISNQAPGGRRTTVSLPKDGMEQVYFRSIQLNYLEVPGS